MPTVWKVATCVTAGPGQLQISVTLADSLTPLVPYRTETHFVPASTSPAALTARITAAVQKIVVADAATVAAAASEATEVAAASTLLGLTGTV